MKQKINNQYEKIATICQVIDLYFRLRLSRKVHLGVVAVLLE